MTDVWRASTAGSDTRRRTRAAAIAASAVCGCLGVAAVFLATLLSPVASAGGDQVSTLQAQAAQLSHQMLLEQLQISGFQQQHAVALSQVQADQQRVVALDAEINMTQARIARDLRRLQGAAIQAYVDGSSAYAGTTALFAKTAASSAGPVYEQVMTGDVSGAVAQLRADRRALRTQEAQAQALAAQDQQTAAHASVLLASAQQTQASLQQQSASISGQLANAIAQQQAAQAAAAAAAIAAAQARAQQAAQVAGAGAGGTGGALPALNPFLQCVIQAESGGNYGAVSPTGQYMGAFQFSQPTWNEAARLAGRPTLVGVPPNLASPADQDALAIALYNAVGEQPWYDPCRNGG